MFLTDEDVIKLTGRVRWNAQVRQLQSMGIEYFRDADGRPVVLSSQIRTDDKAAEEREIEPNWSALDGTKKKAS